MTRFSLILSLLLLLACQQTQAYSRQGHIIVALMAYEFLSDDSQYAIDQLRADKICTTMATQQTLALYKYCR